MTEKNEDTARKEKFRSRKWLVTVWAMVMASVIVLSVLVSMFTRTVVPEGAITLAGVLSSTGIAYITGNTYQKTHQREDGK